MRGLQAKGKGAEQASPGVDLADQWTPTAFISLRVEV